MALVGISFLSSSQFAYGHKKINEVAAMPIAVWVGPKYLRDLAVDALLYFRVVSSSKSNNFYIFVNKYQLTFIILPDY